MRIFRYLINLSKFVCLIGFTFTICHRCLADLSDQVPPKSVNDLESIYRNILNYREKTNEYPKELTDLKVLYPDYPKFLSYLFSLKVPEAAKFGYSPNTIYYQYTPHRPNGKMVGSVKDKGLSDILIETNIYNVWQQGKNWGGIAILRDTGDIEFIPIDMINYQFSDAKGIKNKRAIPVFPFQAGVVPERTVTYSEFMTSGAMFKFPPIGRPNFTNKATNDNNGAPESLILLSRLMNYPPHSYGISREKLWEDLDPAQDEFSLDNIKVASTKLGLSLQKKIITLDELQKLHTPAMLYLSDAGRIVTMSTIDDDHAIILDRGMTLIVSRTELAKRYDGEALIAASVNVPSSLLVDQPIRFLDFSSKDAEVTQNVKITNRGTKAISLLIERPLCGITDAKLSQDNLAPGKSANLELHFKWRTVLPGDHQSTFVTLKSDDSTQPRVQLGFDLKLSEGK